MRLYHVTPTRNVARILKSGLRRFQTSQWIQAATGERYGNGEVFAFSAHIDALKWAAHMDWELNQRTGTGKMSIIEFDAGDQPWEIDHSDPLRQSGREGDWLKSELPVPASRIEYASRVTEETIALLMAALRGE